MQLRRDHLNFVPIGQILTRYAHRVDHPVMTGLGKPVARILLDQLVIGLFMFFVARVLIETEISIAIVRLRIVLAPRSDLIGIDTNLVFFDPGPELPQFFRILIFRDPGIQPVVPVMHAADQIIIVVDMSIGHQRAAVKAAAIEHRNLLIELHHDEIDLGNQRISRLSIFEL